MSEIKKTIHQIRADYPSLKIGTLQTYVKHHWIKLEKSSGDYAEDLRKLGYKYTAQAVDHPEWHTPAETALKAFHDFEGFDQDPSELIYQFFRATKKEPAKITVWYKIKGEK